MEVQNIKNLEFLHEKDIFNYFFGLYTLGLDWTFIKILDAFAVAVCNCAMMPWSAAMT